MPAGPWLAFDFFMFSGPPSRPTGSLDAELLRVLRVQPLPAAELHRRHRQPDPAREFLRSGVGFRWGSSSSRGARARALCRARRNRRRGRTAGGRCRACLSRARQRRVVVCAPLVEAEQHGSVRVEELTKVWMRGARRTLAEQRLVPPEAPGHVPHADDRPRAVHGVRSNDTEFGGGREARPLRRRI